MKRYRHTLLLRGLAAAGVLASVPSSAEVAQGAPDEVVSLTSNEEKPAFRARGRFDLSHTVSDDDLTARHYSFTDLRVKTDESNVLGDTSFRLDGRARKSWTELASDRLSVTDLYLRYGEHGRWRVTGGRQVVRDVGSAQVDGLSVEHQLTEATHGAAFAGLMPSPLTGALNTDFLTAGLGYGRLAVADNHSGGLVLSTYRGGADRLYLSQQSTASFGSTWLLSGFARVDLFAPRAYSAADPNPPASLGVDPTQLYGLVRYRPVRRFTSALTLSHYHTILPGLWWTDWIAEQRRLRGFSLEGEPGTRVSGARWTNTFEVTPQLGPYVRLRADHRHTGPANGYEGMLGLKWRPGDAFVDGHYAYRSFFNGPSHVASLTAGYDRSGYGAEAGGTAMTMKPFSKTEWMPAYDLYGTAWVGWKELGGGPGELRFSVQYQLFIDKASVFHVVMTQLGYHF